MNETHTFPLPELEAHKLDGLEAQLQRAVDEVARPLDDWIKNNALAAAIIAGAVGYLVGRELMKTRP